ncbi:Wzz/FepE/Etk N-terminal domain-containing protein [Hydrogenovibrio kuenenii]|uniref:Wzz/FepE/Etk N-terminal domain-containing protein n=1 Tax=Hydrogenovibrio kuenenii TaxID=63658 RepID=UPI000465A999|nr:Wzz/FepE/Etk N-terminal domain-containing protein [Hydrogenovibrio kuenenii]
MEDYIDNKESVDFARLYKDFKSQYKLISVVTLVVILIGMSYLVQLPNLYGAKAVVQVMTVIKGAKTTEKQISSQGDVPYNEIEKALKTKEILDAIVPATIKVDPKKVEGILYITATAQTPDKAKEKVRKAFEVINERYQKIYSRLEKHGFEIVSPTELVGPIDVSRKPVSPNKPIIITATVVIGMLLGLFLAYLRILIIKND